MRPKMSPETLLFPPVFPPIVGPRVRRVGKCSSSKYSAGTAGTLFVCLVSLISSMVSFLGPGHGSDRECIHPCVRGGGGAVAKERIIRLCGVWVMG